MKDFPDSVGTLDNSSVTAIAFLGGWLPEIYLAGGSG